MSYKVVILVIGLNCQILGSWAHGNFILVREHPGTGGCQVSDSVLQCMRSGIFLTSVPCTCPTPE